MTSLTTMFVVGPNEYVEFNESWGSKAFLQHVWDQSQIPLESNDIAEGTLHSAGARISSTPPPRIEFPIVLRVKGKGTSTYKATGKWISWNELSKRNPLAVKSPPNLDDFIANGAEVGKGPKLKPGEFASRNEPMDKVKKQAAKAKNSTISDLEADQDGWIGGSNQSIYAVKSTPASHTSPPPANSKKNSTPATPSSDTSDTGRTKSLLERLEMAEHLQTPPPKTQNGRNPNDESPASASSLSPFRATPSSGIRRPGAKLPSPLPLESPARNKGPLSPSNTRTPLSASHPIPETPLKLSQRGGPQTPATPHYPLYPNTSQSHDGDASRASGLGLGLTPLKQPIPLAGSPESVRSPLHEPLNLRSRAAAASAGSNGMSTGSPLKPGRSDLHGSGSLGMGSAGGVNNRNSPSGSGAASSNQIDSMLERLRSARSGLGTSASMWAPKSSSSSEGSDAPSNTTTSHTIGAGFASSNLLGVHTGAGRSRPTHRANGLQLSLGQEINVMQDLDEKAEESLSNSNKSSAAVGETFQINHGVGNDLEADEDGWYGNVVPPTPALGCDSPSSSDDEQHNSSAFNGKASKQGAFGWGSARSKGGEARKGNLFSKLPSSSRLDANWSGDDDEEKQDDMQVFEGMQRAAKASNKEKKGASHGGSGSFNPLPPPPIQYKSRTPSPTGFLAISPKIDEKSPSSPSLGIAVRDQGSSRASSLRLSPVSNRSHLPSDDSDADADGEADQPRRGGAEKKGSRKKSDPSPKAPLPKLSPSAKEPAEQNTAASYNLQETQGPGLEKKRSIKRDKSERIRGRRQSQSKDKDVDKVKLTALAPQTDAKTGGASDDGVHRDLSEDVAKIELSDRNEPDGKTQPPFLQPASSASNSAEASHATHEEKTEETGSERVELHPAPTKEAPSSTHVVPSIPRVKDDLFSSSSETKGALENVDASASKNHPVVTQSTALKAETEDKAEPVEAVQAVAQEPEQPKHQPSISLDWAAEDSDLDDELPDLDDWGVTITPAKPTSIASSAPAATETKTKKEQNTEVWKPSRKSRDASAAVTHPQKDGRRQAEKKELFPTEHSSGKRSDDTATTSLGMRIAGRAKETNSASPKLGSSSPSLGGAPAATPYGRWNKSSSTSGETPPASTLKGSGKGKGLASTSSASSSAVNSPREREVDKFSAPSISIKGAASKKAGGEEESGKSASNTRPRLVPDLNGILAKHLGVSKESQDATKKPKVTAPSETPPPQEGSKPTPPPSSSAADSIHAPSVKDSIHAPKPGQQPPVPPPTTAMPRSSGGNGTGRRGPGGNTKQGAKHGRK